MATTPTTRPVKKAAAKKAAAPLAVVPDTAQPTAADPEPAPTGPGVGQVVELAGRFGIVVDVTDAGVRVAWLNEVTDPVDLAMFDPVPEAEPEG